MGYWTDKAKDEGPQRAPAIPAGQHRLEILKIVYGKGAGENYQQFQTKAGDPQIMVVFRDKLEREAAEMFTLSDAAAFKIAKLLEAIGADLESMESDGITVEAFAEPQFANAQLVGRVLQAQVAYEEANGKHYAKITPAPAAKRTEPEKPAPTRKPSPQAWPPPEPAAEEDDIPL